MHVLHMCLCFQALQCIMWRAASSAEGACPVLHAGQCTSHQVRHLTSAGSLCSSVPSRRATAGLCYYNLSRENSEGCSVLVTVAENQVGNCPMILKHHLWESTNDERMICSSVLTCCVLCFREKFNLQLFFKIRRLGVSSSFFCLKGGQIMNYIFLTSLLQYVNLSFVILNGTCWNHLLSRRWTGTSSLQSMLYPVNVPNWLMTSCCAST